MSIEPEFRPLVQQVPLWRQLVGEISDVFAPPAEPELKLESKPIPVKSIWSRERNWGKRVGSVAIHVAVIAILMLPLWRPVRTAMRRDEVETMMPALLAPGPSLPRMKRLAGGEALVVRPLAPTPAVRVASPHPVTPPLELLPATAAANLLLPTFGATEAVGAAPGSSAGHSGAGPGGAGDGSGGGDCAAGPCGAGGDVSDPVPVYEPDPEYSDAARKAKFQGVVVVSVVIGADGRVYDPKVVQPLGLGLDEKALEAVRLWRFEPAKRRGEPVRVAAKIEVNFHLY